MFAPTTEVHIWKARFDSKEAARWALRTVLGRYLDAEPEEIELQPGPHGKPALAEPSADLRFNLSHSGNLALVAIAWGQEVGVDIERIRPRRDLLALARRALEPAEAAKIARAPARARAATFHAAWARREAIAKCLGTGLAAPLLAAAVTVSDLDAGPGFAAAIAVTGDALPPLRRFVAEPGLVSSPVS